jgi:hypothetical protein
LICGLHDTGAENVPEMSLAALERCLNLERRREDAREPAEPLTDVERHVFISYCRPDRKLVKQLQAELAKARVPVWLDNLIEGGEPWPDEVEKAIKQCFAFIVCFSKTLTGRRKSEVFFELNCAIGRIQRLNFGEKFLIVLRLSDCQIPGVTVTNTKKLTDWEIYDYYPEAVKLRSLRRILKVINQARGMKR